MSRGLKQAVSDPEDTKTQINRLAVPSTASKDDKIATDEHSTNKDRGRPSEIQDMPGSKRRSLSNIPEIPTRSPSRQRMSVDMRREDFHAFFWFGIKRSSPLHSTGDDQVTASNVPVIRVASETAQTVNYPHTAIDTYLMEVESAILNSKNRSARKTYRQTALKSHIHVEKALVGLSYGNLDDPLVLDRKTELVRGLKSVFELFLPIEFEGTMPSKFWGIVDSLVTVRCANA